jgi:uncharacterized membrane protein
MKKLFLLGSIILFFACEGVQKINPDDHISVEEGKSKKLRFEQKDSEIDVKEIADSRCPEDVNCIRAGEVIVRFDITIGNDKAENLKLCLGCEGSMEIPSNISFSRYSVKLLEVNPSPNTNTPNESKTAVFSIK